MGHKGTCFDLGGGHTDKHIIKIHQVLYKQVHTLLQVCYINKKFLMKKRIPKKKKKDKVKTIKSRSRVIIWVIMVHTLVS